MIKDDEPVAQVETTIPTNFPLERCAYFIVHHPNGAKQAVLGIELGMKLFAYTGPSPKEEPAFVERMLATGAGFEGFSPKDGEVPADMTEAAWPAVLLIPAGHHSTLAIVEGVTALLEWANPGATVEVRYTDRRTATRAWERGRAEAAGKVASASATCVCPACVAERSAAAQKGAN